MEIIRIFKNENQSLYAVKYSDKEDELNRLFDLWQDIQFLEDFFETNKRDLQRTFWNNISIDAAVLRTLNDANGIMDEFENIFEEKDGKTLNNLFNPLDNIAYRVEELEKSKARSYRIYQNSWLRLYAIKLESDSYIITGGAIKLTRSMQDRDHTQKELRKLDMCRDFLRSEGIYDEDGLTD